MTNIEQSIAWIEQELNDLANILIDGGLTKEAEKQYKAYYHTLEESRAKLIKLQSNRR